MQGEGGMIAAIIVGITIVLGLGASVYNDSKNPEAARVSPRNNTFIKDDSINNPDSDTDSDTSISEGDSLLGKGNRYSIGSDDDRYAFRGGGSRRKHRKSNKGSKGIKASKGSKGRKSRKHNNKKSKSKNSKSF